MSVAAAGLGAPAWAVSPLRAGPSDADWWPLYRVLLVEMGPSPWWSSPSEKRCGWSAEHTLGGGGPGLQGVWGGSDQR